MQGQLWQECTRCGAEPVCSECERCAKHCRCTTAVSDQEQLTAFEAENPGMLRQLVEHHEQGTREH